MTDSVAQQQQAPGLGTWLYDGRQQAHTSVAVQSQPGAQPATGPVTMATVGRMAIGLVVVIALIVICMYVLKRFGPYKRLAGRGLHVVAGQSVGPRERVVVMEIEDARLVLGVTQHNISMLHKLPARPSTPEAEPASRDSGKTPTFAQAFADNLRQMTTRGSRR